VSEESPAAVAIVPFAVHGDAEFGFLREGMVDLLSTNLDGTAGLRTVDPRAVLAAAAALGAPVSTPTAARELAMRLGAATYVTGDIVEAGGRLRISAALYQVQRGLEPVSRAYAEGAVDSLFAVVDALTVALVADRVQRVGGRLARIAALTTSSIPALRAYLEGERHWRALRLVEAVDALRTATRHDTAFALAWYRLGMASSWDAKVDVAQEAMQRAVRHSAGLSERDRTLIAAYNDVVQRDPEAAERRYRAVVADYPTDVEAWAGLGEMWFHANPWRGRSFEESREAWEHVLRLEPHNVGATWHLAYVSARQGRQQELDTLLSRIRTTVDGGADLSVRAMRAVALGGMDEQNALIAELAGADDFTVILAVWRLAVSTENLDATTRFARLLVQPRRPPEVRALGHGLLAHLHLARGHLKTADAALDSLARLDPAQALEYRTLFAMFPLHPASREKLEAQRTRLRDWHATPAPRLTSVADLWVNAHAEIHPQLRTYLLGLLNARLGESEEADRSAALLERTTGDFDATSLALSQSRGIRAEQQRARGRGRAALALLESAQDRVDFGSARASPFFARSRQRFIRAELLNAAGRDAEALGWYRGLGEIYPHDVVYLAPAYLRRAEIHAERGDTAAAAEHFRRFLSLWKDSDPELRAWTDYARQQLALLTGTVVP
ncbi:MAG: tetratricopeptide repeat protein, partial [Longimicrobiales bacterium]